METVNVCMGSTLFFGRIFVFVAMGQGGAGEAGGGLGGRGPLAPVKA